MSKITSGEAVMLSGHWALAEMQVPYFLVVIKQSEVPQAAVKVADLKFS